MQSNYYFYVSRSFRVKIKNIELFEFSTFDIYSLVAHVEDPALFIMKYFFT